MNILPGASAALLLGLIVTGSAYSQDYGTSPFLTPGGSEADPSDFDLTVAEDPKADLNPVWLYVTTKAEEIHESGELTHRYLQLDTQTESRLTALIIEYNDRFFDHDTDLRIQRMCQSYEEGLDTMSAEESASTALRHMETGDELRARRRAVSDGFLAAVESGIGATYAAALIREADTQASYVSTYSVSTTRDWIESHNLDKVGYMRNACGI